jgi:hypothetical protein
MSSSQWAKEGAADHAERGQQFDERVAGLRANSVIHASRLPTRLRNACPQIRGV